MWQSVKKKWNYFKGGKIKSNQHTILIVIVPNQLTVYNIYNWWNWWKLIKLKRSDDFWKVSRKQRLYEIQSSIICSFLFIYKFFRCQLVSCCHVVSQHVAARLLKVVKKWTSWNEISLSLHLLTSKFVTQWTSMASSNVNCVSFFPVKMYTTTRHFKFSVVNEFTRAV